MTHETLTREFWRLWNDQGLGELITRYDEFFTEDLEWHSPITAVAGAHVIGREHFERHVADLLEAFDEIRADLQEVVEVAPDVFRSAVRIHGRGAWAWGSFDTDTAERVANALAKGDEVAI